MRKLHDIHPEIPELLKYLAIGWAAQGYDQSYPLRYHPKDDLLTYLYEGNPDYIYRDWRHSNSTISYVRKGREIGIKAFKPYMVTIV